MPNFNPQTQLTRSEADETLNSFLETGHFILTNKIVTTKPLDYMKKKLAQQPKSSMGFDYKFYLENVIFDIEIPITYSQNGLREYTDDKIIFFLDEIFKFSSNWSVIALDNLTILQEEHYYPLSLNFIWRFGDLITAAKYNQVRRETENKLIVTNTLIITNAEFHSWAWMELLKIRSNLDNLTIELLPNEDQEDNLLLLFESLGFSGINILNLANTKLTAKGYRTLNQLLKKTLILKVLLREPTDPKSRAILKENKERLAYLDRETYLENGWPLAKLNINQLMDDETRTVGHWLLENALAKNDTYMVEYLVKVGADLLEQRDGESPFLLQIFKRNQDFKLIILNHIIYHKTFRNKIEHDLQSYSDSKDIIKRLEALLIAYAQILREKVFGLDGFEMLLNLFKTIAFLPRPSKQRDQEFIDIYWRLFKSVILFHDAQGMVTVESISNVQEILDEIKAISDKADKGIADGSRLHKDLSRQVMFLQYEMDLTKKLLAQANNKDKVTESAEETTNSKELGLDEPGPSSRSFSRR